MREKTEFYFEIPLDKEIENTKKHLDLLKNKDNLVAFNCPVCNKWYRNLANYRELKMCCSCYVKTETAKLELKSREIIGGVITGVKVEEVLPYITSQNKIGISELTIKLSDGRTITLLQDQPVLML